MSPALTVLVIVCVAGTGLVGGVFFAFSGFVMLAVRRLPAPAGIRTMQEINVTAVRAPLMLALFGTFALTIAATVWAFVESADAAGWMLAGTVVYAVGAIAMTIAFHVPRNNRIAALDPEATASDDRWRALSRQWTAGNHLRALAGVAASILFALALLP